MDAPDSRPAVTPARDDRHGPVMAMLLLAVSALATPGVARAQSVAPNRYGTPPLPPPTSSYERQRQATAEVQRRQDDASRKAEQERIGLAIDTNRRKLEVDRARTERDRAAARSPVESERMRQDYEQRRQAYEREREELERQRAASESRPEPVPH